MIEDLRDAPDGVSVDCDLCIIGAGAAGIAMALQFAGTSASVCVLESGGKEFEEEVQDLYAGENVGLPYTGIDATRLRYLGGTTNHWTGRCGPLGEMEMAARPWIADSGWPITRASLEPYYERAHTVCDLSRNLYGEALVEALELDPPPLDRARLRNYIWQFRTVTGIGQAPLRFQGAYRDQLAEAKNIRLLLHANVTNIQTDASGATVEHLDIATLSGIKGRVTARQTVLACGAIENARLLLLSNKVEPAGLGNRHDVVGRYFTEHQQGPGGTIVAKDSLVLQEHYNFHDNTRYQFGLALGPDVQEREQVANCTALIFYTPDPDSGVGSLRHIWSDFKDGEIPDNIGEEVWRVMTDLGGVAGAVKRRLTTGRTPLVEAREILVEVYGEQAPNRDSRVTLSGETDALGLNRTRLDWRLVDQDRRTMEVMMQTLGEEFGRLDIGRVRIDDWLRDRKAWTETVLDSAHHMGTTRMTEDPRKGVVTKDCQVHGVDNLHIAGASVFTTGGQVNPTLSIVALALRLADHLFGRLGIALPQTAAAKDT